MLLFRHGETEWNRIGRLQGRGDSPLSPLGVAQAHAMAAFARGRGIETLLVSPAGRAQTTAGIIASACDARIETHDALSEMDFGECSGLTYAEIELRWPGLKAERQHTRWLHRWPGGENYPEALARVNAWRSALAHPLPDDRFAIVAHQSINRALAVMLAPCTPEIALALNQTSSVVLELRPDGAVVSHTLPAVPRPEGAAS